MRSVPHGGMRSRVLRGKNVKCEKYAPKRRVRIGRILPRRILSKTRRNNMPSNVPPEKPPRRASYPEESSVRPTVQPHRQHLPPEIACLKGEIEPVHQASIKRPVMTAIKLAEDLPVGAVLGKVRVCVVTRHRRPRA